MQSLVAKHLLELHSAQGVVHLQRDGVDARRQAEEASAAAAAEDVDSRGGA